MLLAVRGLAATLMLTGGKDARQNTVKLFDRQILAHVAVRAGAQCGMHLLLVIADPSENNDRDFGINFADEGNERNSIPLGILRSTITTSQSWWASQAAVWKPSVRDWHVCPRWRR